MTILGEPASKSNMRKIAITGRGQHARPRVIKSEKALGYAADLVKQVRRLPKSKQLRGKLRFTCRVWYASERPDLDVSLILDGLQGRIYANDRAVREMHLYHEIDKANPRAQVLLEEMEAYAD